MRFDKNDLFVFIGVAILGIISVFSITRFDNLTLRVTERGTKVDHLKIPILLYHYVEYNQDERDFIRDSLNIEPHIFEKQIITFKDAGYEFITPQDIPELFKDKKNEEKKFVILSFDDGYGDFYTDVYPILKKHNVKAVNYIIYNFLNRLNYMTKSQVKEISESGLVEIGSHTLNHAWLPGMSKENAQMEIIESKRLIEEEFGNVVLSFSYPYGAYDQDSINIVGDSGYTNAVTDDEGNIIYPDHLYEIMRIRPGYNIGEELLNYVNR